MKGVQSEQPIGEASARDHTGIPKAATPLSEVPKESKHSGSPIQSSENQVNLHSVGFESDTCENDKENNPLKRTRKPTVKTSEALEKVVEAQSKVKKPSSKRAGKSSSKP